MPFTFNYFIISVVNNLALLNVIATNNKAIIYLVFINIGIKFLYKIINK